MTVTLSKPQARALWLRASGLCKADDFGVGADGALAVIRRLGYIQIDTIYVIERAHHHVLWSRLPQYKTADLWELLERKKSVFEYWTHALSFIPTEHFRHYVRRMKEFTQKKSRWFAHVTPEAQRDLLKRLRAEGALSIQDFKEDTQAKDHLWASRKPSKRVLEYLFYSGRLTVAARHGMLKKYEILERHMGWEKRPSASSLSDEMDYRLARALDAQGLISISSAAYLEPRMKRDLERAVKRAVELVPVRVEGVAEPFYAREATLDSLLKEPLVGGDGPVHLLSPFDPILIQRKRTQVFFDFDYKLECYTPQPQRKYGYFIVPVLVGDRFVARLDLKAQRGMGRLDIQAWHWEVTRGERSRLKPRIEEVLEKYEAFSCC